MNKSATREAGTVVTGGKAIVDALISNGVNTVFGLPGAQMYPFFDALQQSADRIRTFGARHEQACGYMAFGYARSTGRPGVFSVVPGPGLLNTTAALCTAMGCNAPVLCVTGQIPSAFLGRGRGHLHELPDQLGTLRSIVKWAARIERPEDAPELVNEAFRQMLGGRPGPVVLEMCWDVMARPAFVAPLPKAEIPRALAPSSHTIEAAAALVKNARCPMIMVGSGAQHASQEVQALARAIGAPVAAFRGGRGIMPEDDLLGISSYAAWRLWPDVDLLIGIGSRLEMPYMRWTGMMSLVDRPQDKPLIRIDIDPVEMRRLIPHAQVVADAAEGARSLREALGASEVTAPDETNAWRARIAQEKRLARKEIETVQPQLAYLDIVRDVIGRSGIITTELSQVGFTSYFGYPVYEPRTYISEGFQGTLGFGFPTALGVKAAHPDRNVVCITGDGGFMFAVQELATAQQEKIGLVTLLFNNSAYGNVMRDQKLGFGNRLIGSELENPDFVALGKAFNIDTARVNTPEALRPILGKALASGTAWLIEITVDQDSEASPWAFIHPKR